MDSQPRRRQLRAPYLSPIFGGTFRLWLLFGQIFFRDPKEISKLADYLIMAEGNRAVESASLSQDDAYRQAAKDYAAAIERLARGYESDPELSRDLVQEIHTALWRSFEYFEGQCSLRSWVYRIGHNVAVSHILASRRSRPGELVGIEAISALPAVDDQAHAAEEAQLRRRLLATIHRLKPADRQVILLYLEGLTAKEIGEVTGLSASAVSMRIHRLKLLLADAFSSNGD